MTYTYPFLFFSSSIRREKYSEDDPILAPLHHRYGRALLEHAIATSGALGGSAGGKDAPLPSRAGGASTVAAARAENGKSAGPSSKVDGAGTASNKPQDSRFTFGGDAEESDDEEEEEGGGEGGEEDSDDLGDAFAVLELARLQYEKLSETESTLRTMEGEEWNTLKIKSQLAEVLNDLADVGLETENFQQASSDYQSALELLQPLLLPYSRRLADANLRLGLALEFHPDPAMQASAERYVTAACIVLRKRLDSLYKRQETLQQQRQGDTISKKEEEEREKAKEQHDATAAKLEEEGVLAPKTEEESALSQISDQGKGKGIADQNGHTIKALEKDDIITMDWQLLEKEIKDIKEMIQELELKLEEFANAPPGTDASTVGGAGGSSSSAKGENPLLAADPKAALQQAINEAFLGVSTNGLAKPNPFGSKAADPNVTVNDLSSMVRKKKKATESVIENSANDSNGKRKANETNDSTSSEDIDSSKRTRIEDA